MLATGFSDLGNPRLSLRTSVALQIAFWFWIGTQVAQQQHWTALGESFYLPTLTVISLSPDIQEYDPTPLEQGSGAHCPPAFHAFSERCHQMWALCFQAFPPPRAPPAPRVFGGTFELLNKE